MAVLLTAEQMRYTKASNPFQIKNPKQVINTFTITEESKASDTLKLRKQELIDDLKAFLKEAGGEKNERTEKLVVKKKDLAGKEGEVMVLIEGQYGRGAGTTKNGRETPSKTVCSTEDDSDWNCSRNYGCACSRYAYYWNIQK